MPESVSTFDAQLKLQWSVLLAACSATNKVENASGERQEAGLGESLSRPQDWDSLLQLAEQHGVMPLLHQAVSSFPSAPSAISSLLKQRFETNLHRTLLLTRELIRILDQLESLDISVLPYKGVALAQHVYGDIALRQAGDIDLLILPHDWPRLKQAVHELGYTPHVEFSEAEERAYLYSGYECSFDSTLGRNLLELQWALQPRFYAVDFAMEPLFHRAITINVAGQNMKAPSLEDQFLILCLHAAKHVWGRLIWLCDISQLLKLPALDWEWIGQTAQSLGVVRILQVTLILTEQLLGTPIPADGRKILAPDQVATTLANQICRGIGRVTPPDVESLSYFRLMMRLREHAADRIRFLQRLAFTPGPGEWKSVRLPPPLFPLYRLVRLWRLAARLAKSPLSKQ